MTELPSVRMSPSLRSDRRACPRRPGPAAPCRRPGAAGPASTHARQPLLPLTIRRDGPSAPTTGVRYASIGGLLLYTVSHRTRRPRCYTGYLFRLHRPTIVATSVRRRAVPERRIFSQPFVPGVQTTATGTMPCTPAETGLLNSPKSLRSTIQFPPWGCGMASYLLPRQSKREWLRLCTQVPGFGGTIFAHRHTGLYTESRIVCKGCSSGKLT